MSSAQTNNGVLLLFYKSLDSSRVPQDALGQWLEQCLLPGLRSIVAVSPALYTAVNKDYNKPNLLAIKISDLGNITPEALTQCLRKCGAALPGGSAEGVHVDARMYSFVQLYEADEKPSDPAPKILMAFMQPPPAGAADLDAWYRKEHNEQMSKEPGWWRTTRYSLLHQSTLGGAEPEELSFLAIHAFGEGNVLGTEVKALEPISEWTMQILQEAKGIDAAIYGLVRTL